MVIFDYKMSIISIIIAHFYDTKLHHTVPLNNEDKRRPCLDCFIVNELREWLHFFVLGLNFYINYTYVRIYFLRSILHLNGLETVCFYNIIEILRYDTFIRKSIFKKKWGSFLDILCQNYRTVPYEAENSTVKIQTCEILVLY